MEGERYQVNLRLSQALSKRLDEACIEIWFERGKKISRSEYIRELLISDLYQESIAVTQTSGTPRAPEEPDSPDPEEVSDDETVLEGLYPFNTPKASGPTRHTYEEWRTGTMKLPEFIPIPFGQPVFPSFIKDKSSSAEVDDDDDFLPF